MYTERQYPGVSCIKYVLKGLACLTVLYAFVQGIAQTDGWVTALTWWVSGGISGSVFYALGMMLEYLEDISTRLQRLEHESNKKVGTSYPPKLGVSRANLDKLKDFKI
jgi:hypothetical protein